ncbi:unnamed protein product [Cuscuta epithymum]|uniref:Uncharacterized protein n=1 Tax=Cuscuta epithymum TaxID=186058 RepID=A0AAV0D4P4_9ASTE|nr:unnamed protein product [Cuscuta epithymum]
MAFSAALRAFLILISLHHYRQSSAQEDIAISDGPAPSPSFPSPPLVPALFVIGDSSVDCGTNNFLGTFARADRPPYGRDFDTHQPTGRFSNGRIPVDYLALRLGLPFVPNYLGLRGSVKDMIRGVNYASAGAGIIFSSGSELGQHISLTQQIQQVTDTFQQFTLSMGEEVASDLISKSVFYISMGTNDYIHYYLRNVSNVQTLYLPWRFNQFLAQTMKREIKNLYNDNVRKVVVMGLAPMGCAPYYLWMYPETNGECVDMINDMILEFNFEMRQMVEELAQELVGVRIIFCDAFQASMDIMENHDRYGQKLISFFLFFFSFSYECLIVFCLRICCFRFQCNSRSMLRFWEV